MTNPYPTTIPIPLITTPPLPVIRPATPTCGRGNLQHSVDINKHRLGVADDSVRAFLRDELGDVKANIPGLGQVGHLEHLPDKHGFVFGNHRQGRDQAGRRLLAFDVHV